MMEFPSNLYRQVASRSRLALKSKVDVIAGVLDSDYQGTVNVLLHNNTDEEFAVPTNRAIAQMLILPISQLPLVQVNQLSETL